MPQNCIFCKILSGDIPATLIYEDKDIVAFNDISPQAPTHILVIPRKHISGPASLTAADQPLMGKLINVGVELAKQSDLGDGYRLVMNNGERAGQTVFHLHMHILGGRTMTWPPG